ncbi:hypothetical protein K3169_20155 [Pseudomonas phytophila]|uniref:Uncharacterized protein n=1 Tax=Pseudomonas phytophila TaxID=2867264 RepID=A0ABY6FAI4_9PSED|nr:hypothetical protein [Pseudomonas phytophila]UXZ94656.1 hypothetical protein K3169_20155 [Pseudomonas phytophila]
MKNDLHSNGYPHDGVLAGYTSRLAAGIGPAGSISHGYFAVLTDVLPGHPAGGSVARKRDRLTGCPATAMQLPDVGRSPD